MKRDLDLVRAILIGAEGAEGEYDALADMCAAGFGPEAVAFHVELMEARGLLRARVSRAASGKPVQADVLGLTWEGYDYLDAIRSEKVWIRAKRAISESVGDTTLSVVKDTCAAIAGAMIQSQLRI